VTEPQWELTSQQRHHMYVFLTSVLTFFVVGLGAGFVAGLWVAVLAGWSL
jgi:hypothetical protein